MRYVACRPSSQPRVSIDSGSPASSAARLALDLERDRPLHRPERVHVLDLDPRPERLLAARPERDVGLDPHLAALHVRVAGADRAQQQLELLRVAARLLGRADVRLGDDLHQRRARPVEVDQRRPPAVGADRVAVHELGRVLLEVRARDVHRERAVRGLDREPAGRRERDVVLADLVALGQVRIEVVLALPLGALGDVPPRSRGRSRSRTPRRAG